MNKKLKIAVFHNLQKGGAIKALYDNCLYIKSMGHYIDVYIPDTANETFVPLKNVVDGYYKYPVKRSNFRKYIFKIIDIIPRFNFSENTFFSISFKDFKNAQKDIANDINEKNYDIVFLEQDALFTLSPALLMYLNKPMVYYCQQPFRRDEKILIKLENISQKSFFNKLYDWYFKRFVKLDSEYAIFCDNILVNSYFSHEVLLRVYGLNSHVSYLGVDNNQFRPLDIDRKNFILTVGGITFNKGFDLIIKSIGKVPESIRPTLKIVGYASNMYWLSYLEDLANLNNVNLEILQDIQYTELVKLYNEAKLFLFGSYLEPFGLVSLEAMACGTPVIAVKEGGIREIVQHGKNGLLLDRDEDVFAEGIIELLTNQDLWNHFSKEGPRYVDEFWTLNHSGERLLNHIYRILEKENIKKECNK